MKHSETHLFKKKKSIPFDSNQESTKKSLEPLKDGSENKSPFRRDPVYSQNEPLTEGTIIVWEKQVIETKMNIVDIIN